MIKSITYYLENVNRLDEISLEDLSLWVEENPYSQPLHKLLDLKAKRGGASDGDSTYQNAAYHNIDIDAKYITSLSATAHEATTITAESPSIDLEEGQKATLSRKVVEQKADFKLVAHDEATDTLEELVAEEVLEVRPLEELELLPLVKPEVKPVFHDEASDALEGQVEEELLEESTPLDMSYSGSADKIEEEAVEKVSEPTSKVSSGKSKVKSKKSKITSEPSQADAIKPKVKKQKSKANVLKKVEKLDELKSNISPIKKSSKEKKSNKGKKSINKKTKVKSIKSNSKAKKVKDKQLKTIEAKVKNTKEKSVKSAAKKKEPKASNQKSIGKEVRYIYLEERQVKDYSVHSYEGESEYIKWLMNTKSINTDKNVSDKKKKKKVKPINKAKGKKKKESKGEKIKRVVLKAAEESVKKRDIIISETLADLLAAQGYEKRAKKMYKHLGLIFPEKSSFFAAKIKKLKKK